MIVLNIEKWTQCGKQIAYHLNSIIKIKRLWLSPDSHIKNYLFTKGLLSFLLLLFSLFGSNTPLWAVPSAQIVPNNATVKQGDSITFRNKGSNDDVFYFWMLSGNNSQKATFILNTKKLSLGKHRVLLSVTDQERKQAHATTVLTVVANKSSDNDLDQSTDIVLMPNLLNKSVPQAKVLLQKVGLKLGTISRRQSVEKKGRIIEQSINQGTEVLSTMVVNLVIADEKTVKEPSTKESFNGRLLFDIYPTSQSVTRGDTVIFKNRYEDKISDVRYYWRLKHLKSTRRQFRIDTHSLPVGKYTISAILSRKGTKSVKKEAILEINEPLSRRIPNLIGLSVKDALQVLKEDGFQIGKVTQEFVNTSKTSVIKQSLKAGTITKTGRIVNLVEGVPRKFATSKVVLKVNRQVLQPKEILRLQVVINPKPKVTKGLTYIFTIDGKQYITDKNTYTTHFDKLGIISVNAIVRNKQGALGKSSTLRVNISKSWQQPEARILPEVLRIVQGDQAEFTSTSIYDSQANIKLKWSSKTGHSGSKRRFIFKTKDIKPGEYEIALQVVDNRKKTSLVKAKLVVYSASKRKDALLPLSHAFSSNILQGLNPSDFQPITEGATVTIEEMDHTPNLNLSISDIYARVGHKITFLVGSDIDSKTLQYQFNMGDGHTTPWQTNHRLVYQYDTFGHFKVKASVRINNKRYDTKLHHIWVWSPWLFVVILSSGGLLLLWAWWWTGRPSNSKDVTPSEKPYNDLTRVTLRRLFFYLIQFLLGIFLVYMLFNFFI